MTSPDWNTLETEYRDAPSEAVWRKLAALDGVRAAAVVVESQPESIGPLLLRCGLRDAEPGEFSPEAREAFAAAVLEQLSRWDGAESASVRGIVVYADSHRVASSSVGQQLLSAYAVVAERRGGDASIKRFASKAPFEGARVEVPFRPFSAAERAGLAALEPIFGYTNFSDIPREHFDVAAGVLREHAASPRVAFQALRGMWRTDRARCLPLLLDRLAAHPDEVGSFRHSTAFNAHALNEAGRNQLLDARLDAMSVLLERWDGAAGPPAGLYPKVSLPLQLWSLQFVQVLPANDGARVRRLEAALAAAAERPGADQKTARRAAELLEELAAPEQNARPRG